MKKNKKAFGYWRTSAGYARDSHAKVFCFFSSEKKSSLYRVIWQTALGVRMQDASLVWGADLSASSTGDVALAANTTLGQQRVLRRLLTNPGDYIWQLDYGAGLAAFVGTPVNVSAIRGAIRSQIFKEAAVSRTPEPLIDVQSAADGSVIVQIRYVDSTSGATQVLSFQVGG